MYLFIKKYLFLMFKVIKLTNLQYNKLIVNKTFIFYQFY
jgi:hypothetical protein